MDSIEAQIALIKNDREHGSRWLVREAMTLLRDLAQESMTSQDQQMRTLFSTARKLAQARPAMAALSSAVGQIMSVEGGPGAIAQEARRLLQEYDTATERIATHARQYIKGRLITCSISGTVLDVLAACKQDIQHVTVVESRPRCEGRATAQELARQGLPVTLITDAQADIFLMQSDAVIVGADSILTNGDVLNKAGTALLAWAARGHQVPFYVVCETLKITAHRWFDDPTRLSDNLAFLEDKGGQEVWEQPVAGVTVRNFYFDHTPSELISAWITERGSLIRPEIAEIAARTEANEEHLANSTT